MTTMVVAGALANKLHNGGEAWVRLSWVLGLQRLGVDVFFVEQLSEPTANQRTWFDEVSARFGLAGRAFLLDDIVDATLTDVADDAALLVNISGHLRLPWLLKRFRHRAYVDIDPGFTQYWHLDGLDLGLQDHDLHFTIGENIGASDCPIPTGGIEWRPTRQPVLLDDWIGAGAPPQGPQRLTTVASWRGPYGAITDGARTYGLKVHQFRRFVELPRVAEQHFELALAIHDNDSADRRLLEQHGWELVDPARVAAEPEAFRDYVHGSGGEFSVAQGVYVDTRSGWFSDRTVRYLASGRPALVQDTGFSRFLPAGEGLLAFDSFEAAVAAARRLAADPIGHGQAARALAEAHFGSDDVLAIFLDRAGVD